MDFYPWLLFFHTVSVAIFVVNMLIMQLIFDRVLKMVTDEKAKEQIALFMRKRWHPFVDLVIATLGVTGLILGYRNLDTIMANPIMAFKVHLGVIVLLSAGANHYVFRAIKRRMAENNAPAEKRQRINSISKILARTALVTGVITALSGWYISKIGM